jgi:hypothetical protein
MRSKVEILDKFYDLYQRRLKERKKKYLGKSHMNCKFNKKNRIKDCGVIGFCGNDKIVNRFSRSALFLCNDDEVSAACDKFACKHTDSSVENDFIEIIKSPSRCGQEYPKLAVLIWILQNEDLTAGKETISTDGKNGLESSLFGKNKKSSYLKNILNAVLKR